MMGTPEDRKNLRSISASYPGSSVNFAALKECRSPGKKMQSFFDRVDGSELVIVAEVEKETLSAGVFAEAQHARHAKIPVKVIRDGELISVRSLTVTGRDQKTDWAKISTY